ncbi:acyl-CoA dehydrogenase family protein, partial [Streptomyces sp. NPDC059556]|uniref:acyl-CoA dehydrogenase family protein n=1 Tax=Streptomyces sp. NPDC059556 TaxID=3346863 RepID=UPI00369FE8A6
TLEEGQAFYADVKRRLARYGRRPEQLKILPAAVTTAAGSGARLAGPDAARAAVRRGLLAGAGLLASEQLGLAEWCLEETVRYTRERHQFNRPVGSFQALKHRMAQLWLDLVGGGGAGAPPPPPHAHRHPGAPRAGGRAAAGGANYPHR